MATRVRSYSKINLGLAIGPPRPDGFHGLATLYQTLAMHDLVTVEASRPTSQGRDVGHPGITLATNHAGVPTDARNTAWKMVERALARIGADVEVHIHIQKNLPVQGGMGAGSANAAAALIGLEQELGLKLPEEERLAIAAEVGSDVPLFLIGGAVLGEGRGERVSAMPDLPPTPCVVAIPEVGVSTPRAFQEWDGLCASRGLTYGSGPDRLKELSHVYASVLGSTPATVRTSDTSGIVRGSQGSTRSGTKRGGSEGWSKTSEQGSTQDDLAENALLALVRTGIENDFEQVVFPQYPLLREIKRILMGASAGESDFSDARPDGSNGKALYAALSGSGSALFGLYGSMADARAAQQRVQSSGCKAILTETLPRAEYWGTMFAE